MQGERRRESEVRKIDVCHIDLSNDAVGEVPKRHDRYPGAGVCKVPAKNTVSVRPAAAGFNDHRPARREGATGRIEPPARQVAAQDWVRDRLVWPGDCGQPENNH